jgi:hypothetical protein
VRIALATCSDLPDWEIDDAPLHAALRFRGVEVLHPAWDDARFDWSSWAGSVQKVTALFNPAAVVRWNTHKSYLRDLEARGLPTLPTLFLEAGSPPDLARVLAERGWKRGFIKPAIGATARETLRFNADADGLTAATAHLNRMLAREDMLVQPYLPSVETTGELSAIMIDGAITHTVRKIPVPGDYRVQDDYGARDEPHAFSRAQLALARRAFAAATVCLEPATGGAEAATGGVEPATGGVEAGSDRSFDSREPGAKPFELLYGRADFLRDEAGELRLTELELVEPSLFFRHNPKAGERLADALVVRVSARGDGA